MRRIAHHTRETTAQGPFSVDQRVTLPLKNCIAGIHSWLRWQFPGLVGRPKWSRSMPGLRKRFHSTRKAHSTGK